MAYSTVSDVRILKLSDNEVFDRCKEIREQTGLRLEKIQLGYIIRDGDPEIQAANIDTDPTLKEVLSQKGRYLKYVQFYFVGNTTLRVNRHNDMHFDTLTLTIQPNMEMGAYFKYVNLAKELFGEVEIVRTLPHLVSKEAKEDIEARKAGLVQLETIGHGFFDKIKQMTTAQQDAFLKLQEESHAKVKAREGELDQQHKAKLAEVATKEAELAARVKEVDDRSNRHARRQLRTDLKQTFKDRAAKFKLSLGTRIMRFPIAALYLVLMGVLGYGLYKGYQLQAKVTPGQHDWVLIGQQAALAVGLAVTTGFFIRWNDAWFREHACEEFKLKRLEIDVDRASWICEMALEWKAEVKGEMPQLLMERLSQNIFVDDAPKHEPTSNADTLASAILGTASEVNVKAGNTEIKLDRKSMAQLGDRHN